ESGCRNVNRPAAHSPVADERRRWEAFDGAGELSLTRIVVAIVIAVITVIARFTCFNLGRVNGSVRPRSSFYLYGNSDSYSTVFMLNTCCAGDVYGSTRNAPVTYKPWCRW